MPLMAVPGSERFSSRPIDPDTLAAELPASLPVHTVTQEQIDALDPLTYEVVRHRLWSVTDEMGEALKRMSGSPIVTDANDFDFALSDELGQEVQVGLYNTMLVGAVDLAIYWTLRHRATNPGIAEGDMFLTNDPWVGGGLHQNDAMVFQPVFWEGKLFGWTSAIAHQPDLGGVGLGSFSPAAQDVFSESLPTPPVKVVRDGLLQDDIADMWVRRSRVPMMIGLDLRAKVGANTVGRDRMLAVIEQYGADTVKAVMKRMMSDAESRLRGKLRNLPDGTWRATGYQDQSHTGDRELHKITVAMTKTDGHLAFDFTGTDEQSGVINCTYAGMRGGVMLALLPILAGDIPWSAGGLMRCFDLIAEEGTINNASFPAAVGRGPIGPAWLTGNLVAECLSQMLDQSPNLDAHVQSSCCGTWDTAVIAGLDQRGAVPDAVPLDPHGPDGRRLRRAAAGRRHGHRRAVLHPAGPGARRRDDRVPLPGARAVAPGGARLGRPGPPSGRRVGLDGDHPARHELPDRPRPRLQRQGDQPEQRPRRRLPGQHRGRVDRPRRRRHDDARRRAGARRSSTRSAAPPSCSPATARPTWRPARCSRCSGRAAGATATR